MTGDHGREQEGLQLHTKFSEQLLQDHFRATQKPEHKLIMWTDGQFPNLPAAASSSSAGTSSSAPSAGSEAAVASTSSGLSTAAAAIAAGASTVDPHMHMRQQQGHY